MIQVSANDGSFSLRPADSSRADCRGWQLAARVTDKDLAWTLFGKSYERNSSTIQPKKVGMFLEGVLKAAESADGWQVCACQKLSK